VTIADVAREAGLSKGAVSYALNNKPGVSDDTRDRVRAIAERLGWSVSTTARSLSRSRADAVGLVLVRPARMLGIEPFFMEFVAGIQSVLAASELALSFLLVDSSESEIRVYERWAAQGRVDGLILVDLLVDDPRLDVVRRLGIPTVFVGNADDGSDLPHVWTGEDESMREAAQYLLGLGHRRLAHVGGIARFRHTAIRHRTLLEVAAQAGAPSPIVFDTDFSGESGALATRKLLVLPEPPTAIIYDNDIMAVAGLNVAAELGVPVPEELSLLAWDDSALCEITHPPLSAMHRDVPALGAAAAELLLGVLSGEDADVRGVEGPRARLQARGSTARPPRT
jgi:DNA-binding LacI/PurR family transcriptional regulator